MYKRQPYNEDRIIRIPPLDSYSVGVSWDNGLKCTGAWIWQYANKVVRCIKYMQWRGKSWQVICRDLEKYVKSIDSEIGFQVLPFTMNERSQRFEHLPSVADTVFELLGYEGLFHINPKIGNKATKFKEMHNLLGCCLFDEIGCYQDTECISNYKVEGATAKEKDTNDHATDALSELAVAFGAGVLKENEQAFTRNLLQREEEDDIIPVSYTHLTLPTILRV